MNRVFIITFMFTTLFGCTTIQKSKVRPNLLQANDRAVISVLAPKDIVAYVPGNYGASGSAALYGGIAAGLIVAVLTSNKQEKKITKMKENISPLNEILSNYSIENKLRSEFVAELKSTFEMQVMEDDENHSLDKNQLNKFDRIFVHVDYVLTADYSTIIFDTSIVIRDLENRLNSNIMIKDHYTNRYRIVMPKLTLEKRTASEKNGAKKDIENWYQLERSKLGKKMTQSRKEKYQKLRRTRYIRLKNEAQERSDEQIVTGLVQKWAKSNGRIIKDYLEFAVHESVRLLVLDFEKSKRAGDIKLVKEPERNTAYSNIISRNNDRIVIRLNREEEGGGICSIVNRKDYRHCKSNIHSQRYSAKNGAE